MTHLVGDYVTINNADEKQDITYGKAYEIVFAGIQSVRIIDDNGYAHVISKRDITPVQVCGTNTPEVEETYEEFKAEQRVTSTGLFDKGDVLIYRDGTPTNESRTVTHCTATCVWFEETYSMPFNPNEFTKEGYDLDY